MNSNERTQARATLPEHKALLDKEDEDRRLRDAQRRAKDERERLRLRIASVLQHGRIVLARGGSIRTKEG